MTMDIYCIRHSRGYAPRCGAPEEDTAWTAVDPGAIPILELMGLHGPAGILNLTPGFHTKVATFFRDIAPGAAAVAGGAKPRRTSMKIRMSNKAKNPISDLKLY